MLCFRFVQTIVSLLLRKSIFALRCAWRRGTWPHRIDIYHHHSD